MLKYDLLTTFIIHNRNGNVKYFLSQFLYFPAQPFHKGQKRSPHAKCILRPAKTSLLVIILKQFKNVKYFAPFCNEKHFLYLSLFSTLSNKKSTRTMFVHFHARRVDNNVRALFQRRPNRLFKRRDFIGFRRFYFIFYAI